MITGAAPAVFTERGYQPASRCGELAIVISATADDDLEFERLSLLTEVYDPATKRRLTSATDLTRAHVLEIGAGTGSVARWLGDSRQLRCDSGAPALSHQGGET
ncbi:MAG: hypothetical protein OES24_03855 [Acidimicrobiia bacterium]|nr:hypothetical protein [Acidimicrobiia bacterium]